MSSGENQPSTLKAAIDSVTSTIQAAIGKVAGSSDQAAAAQKKQDSARAEHEASHPTTKTGPVADDPQRTSGSWKQTAGSAKEALGGLVGSDNFKAAGQRQRAEGQRQEAEGQARDLARGVGDRVRGTLGTAVAGLTNDREGLAEYQKMHDDGKARQRGVEAELQKEVEAHDKAQDTQRPSS